MIFNQLENVRKKRGAVALALIDPDTKNHNDLKQLLEFINDSDFDSILVGGSLIMDHLFEERMKIIKSNTKLPVIIFPGSSRQISSKADAILYLSLLSGRNPQYLIGEHIESAPIIYSHSIETIPTGYILLDGGMKTSVEIISNTNPLPMNKPDIILAHSLAAQYLGKKIIFFECGSGSLKHVHRILISYICEYINIPIMIGGGINTSDSARELVNAGAGYIILGTKIENSKSSDELTEITNAIHGK